MNPPSTIRVFSFSTDAEPRPAMCPLPAALASAPTQPPALAGQPPVFSGTRLRLALRPLPTLSALASAPIQPPVLTGQPLVLAGTRLRLALRPLPILSALASAPI